MKIINVKRIFFLIYLNVTFLIAQDTILETTNGNNRNVKQKIYLFKNIDILKLESDSINNKDTFHFKREKNLFFDGYSTIEQGKVNLYEKSSFSNNSNFLNRTYYLKNEFQYEPKLIRRSSKKFIKVCIDYFYDCPKLIKRIKVRKLKYKDIKIIVHYYNNRCNVGNDK
jgi:hypothetical protein